MILFLRFLEMIRLRLTATERFLRPSHYFPHGAWIIRFGGEEDGAFILCMRQEMFGVDYSKTR